MWYNAHNYKRIKYYFRGIIVSIAIAELDQLKQNFDTFPFLKYLFTKLYATLTTLESSPDAPDHDKLELLAFRQANTRIFQFVTNGLNFFASFWDSVAVSFFDEPRVKAWQELENKGLLTDDHAQAKFNAVSMHEEPKILARILCFFYPLHWLEGDNADANIKAIRDHKNIHALASTISQVDIGLLSSNSAQAIFEAILSGDYDHVISYHFNSNYKEKNILEILHRAGLFVGDKARENINKVCSTQVCDRQVQEGLTNIDKYHLLSGNHAQMIIETLWNHPFPYQFNEAVSKILRSCTSNEVHANIVALCSHKKTDPRPLARFLVNFRNRTTLFRGDNAPANHEALIRYFSIFNSDAVRHSLYQIPPHLFTQAYWNQLVTLCAQHEATPGEAIAAVVADIARLVTVRAAPTRVVVDTHTSSVHRSVSESAIKLRNRYSEFLTTDKLTEIYKDITAFIASLPNDKEENLAIKRCHARINAEEYIHTDPGSKVTTKQLLALSWCAIHDDKVRHGSLADATQVFCEGLYECQREYNISIDTGVDTGGSDVNTCPPGEFNKIMEKLINIHPDVQINMVTHQIAGLKFKAVLNEAIQEYFTTRSNPQTAGEFIQLTKDIKQFEINGIEAIWPAIKDSITTRMFDEFGSLYKNMDDPMFTGVIASGVYLETLPGHLPSFQKDIAESKGYHQFYKNVIQETDFGFFQRIKADYLVENRHANAELQHEYDNQYGVVLR
jgi:hypothetical protein